jgi:hypothetical protein
MRPRAAHGIVAIGVLVVIWFLAAGATWAQEAAATLSGTIKSGSGVAVVGAKVSLKNAATGEMQETQTDAEGRYKVSGLAAGDYEVAVSGVGFAAQTSKVTIAAGGAQSLDFALSAAGTQAPANAAAPTLEDLGIPPEQTKGTALDQARLNKRSHMLMLHQRFGLIAAVPLVATVITSVGAGGHSTSTSDRWAHLVLGSATGDLYFLSAYYAIRAPKIPGSQTRGQIRWHKALAWIHGPGMIATPILGAMAFSQKSNGEHVHGIAQAHGPVAIVTAAAYGAAILSVSLKF